MKTIRFLGTNGWYDTATGNTVCMLVDTPEYGIILDAGNGFAKLGSFVNPSKPYYIFISHLHLDHICGLHTLVISGFPDQTMLFVPKGYAEKLRFLISDPYTKSINDLPFKLQIEELEIPLVDAPVKLPFGLETIPMAHATLTMGLRLNLDGFILAYCPDTGWCDGLLAAAANADLLIAECALPPGVTPNPDWPHLNPEMAAQGALQANARQLALVHFDAFQYPDFRSRIQAQKVAAGIFPNTLSSWDGLVLNLSSDSPAIADQVNEGLSTSPVNAHADVLQEQSAIVQSLLADDTEDVWNDV